MNDSLDTANRDPSLAYLLQNVYPVDSERGSAVVGRPGIRVASPDKDVYSGRLSAGVGQLIYQFTKLDGTEYTVGLANGRIFTFNWGTRLWNEAVAAADFVTASITFSADARCYAVTMADKMVVTDGVNKPWMWDGTSGSGGLTPLTNAPVLYGQPTVYYAKLFGIKNTERSTIVWSEENDPSIGYEAGGYNNAWTLGQTDQESLHALVGTNQALYYFRDRSIGVISGAVNDDFVGSGVHDSVSGTVGTQSPGCTVYYEGRIYFVDSNYYPHVIIPGAGVVPLYGDARETMLGLDRSYVTSAVGCYDDSTKMVILGVVEMGQTVPTLQIIIDPRQGDGQVAALWRGFAFVSLSIVKNATGQPVIMHMSDVSYVYDHGLADGDVWSDETFEFTPDNPIEHRVIPSPMGADVSVEKRFDRLDMVFRTQSDLSSVDINYETSRGESSSTTQTLPPISAAFSRWDFAIWDTDPWSGSTVEQHVAVGLNGFGRWIRPSITHAQLGERFALESLRVTAYPLNTDPSTP